MRLPYSKHPVNRVLVDCLSHVVTLPTFLVEISVVGLFSFSNCSAMDRVIILCKDAPEEEGANLPNRVLQKREEGEKNRA